MATKTKENTNAFLSDASNKLGNPQLYYFDGNAYGNAPDPAPRSIGDLEGDHSFAFRLYAESYNATYPQPFGITTTGGGAASLFFIMIEPSGALRYYSGNGSNYNVKSTGVIIPLVAWTDIIGVISSGFVTLYMGSTTYGPSALTYAPKNFNYDINIMKTPLLARFVTGYIKDICLWSRALSSGEVVLYQSGGIPHHPAIYAPGNDGTGSLFHSLGAPGSDINLYDGVWDSNTQEEKKVWI